MTLLEFSTVSLDDENSRVPLTLSFQHVQFNEGGLRSASMTASLGCPFQ